jgi:hypothetical protein
VDVALFFIAPHRLRPLDVNFIVELAELVPVVSLLAGLLSLPCTSSCAFAQPVHMHQLNESDWRSPPASSSVQRLLERQISLFQVSDMTMRSQLGLAQTITV